MSKNFRLIKALGMIGCLLTVGLVPTISGQTKVDLREQARNVDFSQATSTKPFKSGTAMPALCSTGDVFFKTDAAPGKNVYLCSAPNNWVDQAGTLSYPANTADIGTPAPPASGTTTWYTREGKLCALDPSGNESCTGGGSLWVNSSDGSVSVTKSGNTLQITAGPAMATVDGNNAFTGDNRYSERCTANATGTQANRWVQKTSTGCQVSGSATRVFGLASATASSGSVTIFRAGRWKCAYSNTAVLGNWATVTSDGRCADSGVAAASAPPAGAVAVAEASGAGSVLVSIWPAPSASGTSTSSPIVIARTKSTTVGSGDTDIDSVNTTIDAGKCVRVQAHVENLTLGANPDVYLHWGSSSWLLETGSTGTLWVNGTVCNASGVQNSQVVYAAAGVGTWYGNAGTIKATASVDTSSAAKISISANSGQQMRMNWLVEKLY
jgi:hypothetical protein